MSRRSSGRDRARAAVLALVAAAACASCGLAAGLTGSGGDGSSGTTLAAGTPTGAGLGTGSTSDGAPGSAGATTTSDTTSKNTTVTVASSNPRPAARSVSSRPVRTTRPSPSTPVSRATTRVPRPRPPSATTVSPAPTAAGESAVEADVVRLVNVQRQTAGCKPLTVDATLATVARAHSKDMAVNGYFAHNSQDGRTPFARMTAAGYRFVLAAENIAAGQPTAAAVMDAWMNSAGHRANILNCGLKEIGVGVYSLAGSPYSIYWTQDFGTRP